MWLIIILLAVIAFVVCGVASSQSDNEEAARALQAKAAAAKRPEALAQLLAEEFPEFADAFTFSRCEQAIRKWEGLWNSKQVKAHLTLFGKKYRSDVSQRAVERIFAAEIAPNISDAYEEYSHENPSEFFAGFTRAMVSSLTISGS